jgi:hypothetical protein
MTDPAKRSDGDPPDLRSHDWGPEWDRVADVVVVGAGAAGYTAALTAAREGASVLLLERGAAVGGTTAKSGGSIWIPNNSVMRAAGFEDSRDDALRYLARVGFPASYSPDSERLGLSEEDFTLLEALYDHGHVAIDTLLEMGAIAFKDRRFPNGDLMPPYPDYQADLPENKGIVGRALSPRAPDGATIPDGFTDGHGFLVGGLLLIEGMRQVGDRLGVTLRVNQRVLDTVSDDAGGVIGVLVRSGNTTELVGARRGVIFATGGFLMNPDMRHYLRGPVYGGCAAETCTGDFVTIGGKLGARFGNMSQAWWDQMVLELALRARSTTEDVWYPFGDSMIQVNKLGHRVGNEKQPYSERAQVHFYWNPSEREYTNQLMFQVWDDAVAQNPLAWPYRGLTPMPGETPDYVISAGTLDELAAKVDARLVELAAHTGGTRLSPDFASTLKSTVARFNEFARTGVDLDFHRGEAALQPVIQGPPREGVANPCMAEIADRGPYHCMILVAGALDTKGGPRINPNAQVLSVSGEPIARLYGAGNCISAPVGQSYPGAGGTIGSAITFGYLAGRHASSQPPSRPPVNGDVD